MKYLIVPAFSALLLAGLTAQADAAAQPSPATVPAGAVDNSGPPADSGHGRRPHGGATTTGGAGVNTTGGANTTGGLFTGGTPRTGRTRQGTGHGQGGAATGGANTGGLFTGAPTGHRTGGATNVGGGHAGTNVFGTRPRNWNRFPHSFDRGTYQRNVTAPRRFRWQTYHRPHGWYARRWTFGQVLPSVFWASNYWLSDYWMFDLPIPPYGYVWVRYGDDALLVNKRTGQILQVVYGLFD